MRASSSMWASTTDANRRSSLARSPGATLRQPSNACRAWETAASGFPGSTVAISSSVAGSITLTVSPKQPPRSTAAPERSQPRSPEETPPSQPLEPPDQLPVGHGGVEGFELHAGGVAVVLDDLLPEGVPCHLRGLE